MPVPRLMLYGIPELLRFYLATNIDDQAFLIYRTGLRLTQGLVEFGVVNHHPTIIGQPKLVFFELEGLFFLIRHVKAPFVAELLDQNCAWFLLVSLFLISPPFVTNS